MSFPPQPAKIEFSRQDVNRALLAGAFALLAGGAPVAAQVAPLFDFAIAGGFYHGLSQALPGLKPGGRLLLAREADNPFDGDAVAVHRLDGLKLGYIPRAANTPVARFMDRGRVVRAEIVGMLAVSRVRDIPPGLVFTGFSSGDPMVRLILEGPAE